MGRPYILHPLRVMAKMVNEQDMCIALLHDILEGSDFTANDLLKIGFSTTTVETIVCLSRHTDETYDEFIQRVKRSPKAVKVKKADLEDNLDVTRLNKLTPRDLKRIKKYLLAWKQLQDP